MGPAVEGLGTLEGKLDDRGVVADVVVNVESNPGDEGADMRASESSILEMTSGAPGCLSTLLRGFGCEGADRRRLLRDPSLGATLECDCRGGIGIGGAVDVVILCCPSMLDNAIGGAALPVACPRLFACYTTLCTMRSTEGRDT